ncbi:MAG TPA: hypothetical protein PKN27_07965 [Propionibacteriaceae bacterium]|nr:hypothetical protein [Propionibacteriaceae bacterium]
MNRKLLVLAAGLVVLAVLQGRHNARQRERTRDLWERATAD